MPRHIEIPLDKMRRIRYNINAMVELEEIFEGGLGQVFSKENVGFKPIRDLIYIGLKHGGDKGITPEETGDLISQYVMDPGKPLEDILFLAMKSLSRGGFIPAEAVDGYEKKLLEAKAGNAEEDEEDDDARPPDPAATEDPI